MGVGWGGGDEGDERWARKDTWGGSFFSVY